MPGNLMKRAAAFRRKHPSLSMQEAVKKVAAADRAGKKPAARKKAAPRKKKAAVGSTKSKLQKAGYTITKSPHSTNYYAKDKKTGTTYADSLSALAKRLLGKSSQKVGKVRKRKKAAPKKRAAVAKKPARKIKVKVKGGTVRIGAPTHSASVYKTLKGKGLKLPHGYQVERRTSIQGISGINHAKVGTELRHKQSLESALKKHRELLKKKGLTPGEKSQIRHDIDRYRKSVAESKKHISELKRFI